MLHVFKLVGVPPTAPASTKRRPYPLRVCFCPMFGRVRVDEVALNGGKLGNHGGCFQIKRDLEKYRKPWMFSVVSLLCAASWPSTPLFAYLWERKEGIALFASLAVEVGVWPRASLRSPNRGGH